MAAIDKIYGTPQQWDMLQAWLVQNNANLIKNMYCRPESGEGPLANFDSNQDRYLYLYCPLDFVLDRLREQYKSETLDSWKSL